MTSQEKFTQDELQKLFGKTIPIEAVNLLWNSPGTTTIGEIRAKLREMAVPHKRKAVVVEEIKAAFDERWPHLVIADNAHDPELNAYFGRLAANILAALDHIAPVGVPFDEVARIELSEIGNIAYNMRQKAAPDPTEASDEFKRISERAERLLTLVRKYPL